MYELVIVWASGETEVYEYEGRKAAENAGRGYRMAFGTQVAWYGVRRAW